MLFSPPTFLGVIWFMKCNINGNVNGNDSHSNTDDDKFKYVSIHF
jgi:hypothetical protein